MEDLEESIANLEQDLGLPDGFYLKLRDEGDWSFVIKLHALIECATAEQLTCTFRRRELADVFSRFELSNTKTGKLALISALNLLPKAHIVFIRKLSELRNALVHKVQNVNLSLTDYFMDLANRSNAANFKNAADQWAFSIKVEGEQYVNEPIARYPTLARMEVEGGTFIPSRAAYLLVAPKIALWSTALAVLDAISLCNRYGPQMWSFLMECEEQRECEDWVHELFAKAKVGDPDLPEQMARKLEALMPHVQVKRDKDGQPILESLAAAMSERKNQISDSI